MKKNIIYSIGALLCVAGMFSCSGEMDVTLENDMTAKPGEAYSTINQYTPGAGYSADNDTQLRFTFNNNTVKAYCLAELEADKDSFIALNGEAAYCDYVVENGTELNIDEETHSVDSTFTGIFGKYAITVVSINAQGKKKANAIGFTGLSWLDVCTGTYYTSVLTPMGIPESLPGIKLQVADTDPNLFRIVSLYKNGYHIKFNKIENQGQDDSGVYNFIRVAPQNIGLSYGNYGAIGIQDIGYWQGNDAFVLSSGYEGGMYADNNIFFYVEYFVSAGNLGYNYEYFVPDAE